MPGLNPDEKVGDFHVVREKTSMSTLPERILGILALLMFSWAGYSFVRPHYAPSAIIRGRTNPESETLQDLTPELPCVPPPDVSTLECRAGAKRGYCDPLHSQFRYMAENCRTTCRLCNEGVHGHQHIQQGHITVQPLDWLDKDDSAGNCERVNKYVFVKTHKTGGSTVANILHRRTWQRHLKPIFPKNLINMGWPSQIRYNHVLGNAHDRYNVTGDVISSHMFFTGQTQAVTKTLVPDAVYFTILRDPVHRLISAFNYYALGGSINKHMTNHNYSSSQDLPKIPIRNRISALETFAANAPQYLHHSGTIRPGRTGPITTAQVLLQNSMAYDLGIVGEATSNMSLSPTELEASIKRLDKTMRVVLINEYWDESMILLKRMMCWEMHDLLYIALKSSSSKPSKLSTGSIYSQLSEHAKSQLHALVDIDAALYKHFNRTFWQRIAQEKNFFEEVDEFRTRVSTVTERCQNKSLILPEHELLLCTHLHWENVKFGCELAKVWGFLPQDHYCKACSYRCSTDSLV
eukprot:m.54152 g.54152  ORF g.54152 m.54152 type:complete len:521 (+) comp10906_c0_seq1:206-1768(+)